METAVATEEGVRRAVNLYVRARGGYADADLELAEVFGRHASVALMSAQFRESLRAAVESRHVIGQAQGILMESYQVDAYNIMSFLLFLMEVLHAMIRVAQTKLHCG